MTIHLEDTNHLVVDEREFQINHQIILLKEISTAEMSGEGYMLSHLVVINLLCEIGIVIPSDELSNQNIYGGEQCFKRLPTVGRSAVANPSPYRGVDQIPASQ